jgi:hypothetical protein
MHSLTPALDGGEWSASYPGRFTPRERAPDAHWMGGWVGPRTGRRGGVYKIFSSRFNFSLVLLIVIFTLLMNYYV